MRRPPAIVLGAHETGLAVARALGRAGIPVRVLSARGDPPFRSRYGRPVRCPDPVGDEEAFLSFLESLAPRDGPPPVLFPTSDDFVPTLSHHRERLERRFALNVPDAALVDAIVDKASQALEAARVGVPSPVTFAVSGREEIPRTVRDAPLPVFVKARSVNAWRREVGPAVKGWVVDDRETLRERLYALIDAGVEPLVQERIPGPDTHHFKFCAYIDRRGVVRATAGLRKLRQYPPRAGFGCAVVSHLDPEVEQLGLQLFLGLGYRGVGSAEFKRDDRDGSLRLIELNPRYWQQNALAAACGTSFPLFQYADLAGLPLPRPTIAREGVRWISLARDIDSFRHDHAAGTLSTAAWLWSLRPPRLWSVFAWDDPAPSLQSLLAGGSVRQRLGGLRRRLHLPALPRIRPSTEPEG